MVGLHEPDAEDPGELTSIIWDADLGFGRTWLADDRAGDGLPGSTFSWTSPLEEEADGPGKGFAAAATCVD